MTEIAILTGPPNEQAFNEFNQVLSKGEYYILRRVCESAGIDIKQVPIIPVLPEPLYNNRLDYACTTDKEEGLRPAILRGKFLRTEYAPILQKTLNQLDELKPNIIIVLGLLPLWLMTKSTQVKKMRGNLQLDGRNKHKLLTTWDFRSIFANYPLLPELTMDFMKAVRHSKSPTFTRPSRKIWLEPTLADLTAFWDRHLEGADEVGCDIETKARQITEIAFSPNPHVSLVIPFFWRAALDGSYWKSVEEEVEAWEFVRKVLVEKKIVGQNFTYDMRYLWEVMGIPSWGFHGDTMLQHHALQPEMRKALGYLASLYTDEPVWKTMRADADKMKKED